MKTRKILSSHLTQRISSRALLAFLALGLLAQSALAQPIAPSAWQQMSAITQLKRSLTAAERKIDTRLQLEVMRQRRDMTLGALPKAATGVEVDRRGAALVDLRAEVTPDLLQAIEDLGGTVLSSFETWDAVRARLPLAAVAALAERREVQQIRPADVMMTSGSFRVNPKNTVITEGDIAHRADLARAVFGIDGSGVTSCAMSDSVDVLANLQASGELPATLTVLPGQSGNPGSSEGTALLEIIHDMAPGADLIFATGKGGTAQMAQNILALAAAGCDVIVDDVFYLFEPPFQDGVIAQAVEQVSAAGVFYVTSAGNSGRLNAGTAGVWEGDFVAGALPGPLVGAALAAHDFGGGLIGNQVTEQAFNDAVFFTLWWSNPLAAAADDYDLFLLDNTLTNVIAFSANTQDGDDDPFEAINSAGIDHTGNRLVITKFSGDDQFLQLNTHRGILQSGTNGQISGHLGATSAITVAAVNVSSTNGGAFTGGASNPVEGFSSDGPRRIFFNPDGTPAAPAVGAAFTKVNIPVIRNKPDIAAADGVSTTTPGFNPFFGTSASAPHAAAILTLVKERFPELTFQELKDRLESTSLDIEAIDFDFDSGDGLIDTLELTQPQPIFSDGFESGNTSAWTNP